MNPARLSFIATLVPVPWTPFPLEQHTGESEITVMINTLPPVHWAYPELDSIKLKTAEGNILQPHLDLERSRAIRYRPADQGPFTLTIDDPRFESIVISGIVPSQKPVSANLVGRSAIRLRVFEGENGSEINSWSAAIRLENSSYPSSKEPWDVASIWSKAEPAAMHARTDVFELHGEARD